MFSGALIFVSQLVVVHALFLGATKREASQLRKSYDFIIAGGGTAGLTIADRLTEAFPKSTEF